MKRIVIAALAASLAACGGGDSSPRSPATLSGVASKGLVLNGTVTVEELAADGTVARTLGTTYTNATTGAYSFTLPNTYRGGPIRLRVGPRTGATSEMVCDVAGGCANPAGGTFAFGAHMPLSASFDMQAIIPAAPAGSEVKAAITPLTHMATARALNAATVDRDAVLNALSEINQMVGLDVLAVAPVNPVSVASDATEEQRVYAAFLAGIGEIANNRAEAGFGARLDAALGVLASSFEDGQLVSGSDGISAGDIVTAVNNQGNSIPALDTATLALITSGINAAISSGTYNPEPALAATRGVVAEARALVDDARTFAGSFDGLQQPAMAFSEEMDAAGMLTDERFTTLFTRLGEAMAGLDAAIAASEDFGAVGTSVSSNGYTFSIPAVSGSTPVRLTIRDNNGSDGVTVNLSLNTGISATAWATQLAAAEGAPFDIGSPDATFSGTIHTPQAKIDFTNVALSIGPMASTTGAGPDRIDTLSFKGTLALTDRVNGVSFSGTGEFDSVERPAGVPASEGVAVTPSKLLLKGTFAGLRRSFTGEVSATINNAATLNPTVDESADNFANATIAASFMATFPNFGTSGVSLTFNRTGFEAGNARLLLNRSGRVFTLTVANEGAAPTITLQNPAGIKLQLTQTAGDAWEGHLVASNSNRLIGEITTGEDGLTLVRYEDGTFETLM